MTRVPSQVVERFAGRQDLPLAKAENVYDLLEEFLDAASDRALSPSTLVDEAWHEFILDTRLYADYCHKRFGYFVHHVPKPKPAPSCDTGGTQDEDEDPKQEDSCGTGIIELDNTSLSLESAPCDSGGGGDQDSCSSDCRSFVEPQVRATISN